MCVYLALCVRMCGFVRHLYLCIVLVFGIAFGVQGLGAHTAMQLGLRSSLGDLAATS